MIIQSAEVERDGKFWFGNLPLAAGSTSLTLTEVDYWGNSTSTNISVNKSSLQLTIDEPNEELLNTAAITVTGTINVSDQPRRCRAVPRHSVQVARVIVAAF